MNSKYLVIIILSFMVSRIAGQGGNIQIRFTSLQITEIMAGNSSFLMDEDYDYPDWIEIHNPTSQEISLGGWYLTNSKNNLSKWEFPDVKIKAGAYLLVFASGKNRVNPGKLLHTNFKLNSLGDFLALVEPDGATIVFAFTDNYPAQYTNVSYGLDSSNFLYLATPTPGSANIVNEFMPPPQNIGSKRFLYRSLSG